jgi:spermidine synthase
VTNRDDDQRRAGATWRGIALWRTRRIAILAFVAASGCVHSGSAPRAAPETTVVPASPPVAASSSTHAVSGGSRVLFDKRSAYARVLVTENDGVRCLAFDSPTSGRQSCVDQADPERIVLEYVRYIPVGLVFVPEPRRALMLGLGGGSIVRLLLPRVPRLHMDVVEIDPVVIEAARLHFGVADSGRLRVVEGDGRAFVARAQERWDLIVLDAFGEDYIPFPLTTVDFFREVERRLAPGGAVVANFWSTHRGVLRAQLRTLQEVFPALHVFDGRTSGNVIAVAARGLAPWSRERVLERAGAIAPGLGFRFDFLEAPSRYVPLDSYDLGNASVLVDGRADVYEALRRSW